MEVNKEYANECLNLLKAAGLDAYSGNAITGRRFTEYQIHSAWSWLSVFIEHADFSNVKM